MSIALKRSALLAIAILLLACGSSPSEPKNGPCGLGSTDIFCTCPTGYHSVQVGNNSEGLPIFGCAPD
jgi:hypothetical protein